MDLQRHMSWSHLCSVIGGKIVRFVYIGEMVDHRCLNFLFIIACCSIFKVN